MAEICGLKNCNKQMGPGAAEVGFTDSNNRLQKVRVCPKHAWLLMTAPRGTYVITDEKVIQPIAAKPIIIT